jgi:hypothetical protein
VVHWTTLSLIADFLIVKRIVLRQNVSLRLILLRACLLILSLAQDLGYIAGFALMSFTISILFIAILHVYRHLRNPQVQQTYLGARSQGIKVRFCLPL